MGDEHCEQEILPLDWPVERIRSELCRGLAYQYLSTVRLLQFYGVEAVREFNRIFIANKDYFRASEISSPLDLARLLGEFEANVFGGTMQISGDGTSACLRYVHCAEWAAVEALGDLTEEQRETMAADFFHAMHDLASEFGYSAEVTYATGSVAVTFHAES